MLAVLGLLALCALTGFGGAVGAWLLYLMVYDG